MKLHLVSFEEEIALFRREKGNTCISIIVPTHQLSPDRSSDPLLVAKAIEQARIHLEKEYPGTNSLAEKLIELYREIDFNHNATGIGLYVSERIKLLLRFFFPVKEKILVADSFDIRDILYQDYYALPYYLLHLEEKKAKLFKGRLGILQEVTDAQFPKVAMEDYEYNRPSRGSSYVGHAFVKEFEKDKSQVEEKRFVQFSKEVDGYLNQYLHKGTPLILAGAEKDLAMFKTASRHTSQIAGELPGNHVHTSISRLEEQAWMDVKSHLDQVKRSLVDEFREKTGQGLGVSGLVACWKAAAEGKGLVLLVEKDYSVPGYLSAADNSSLHIRRPSIAHKFVSDAVNALIEMVHDKNGKVILVENGWLEGEQRVALTTGNR